MRNKKLLSFSFIANFRGGTYCTQVKASDVNKSVLKWIVQIKKEKSQIQYLGDKIIDELNEEAKNENNFGRSLERTQKYMVHSIHHKARRISH